MLRESDFPPGKKGLKNPRIAFQAARRASKFDFQVLAKLFGQAFELVFWFFEGADLGHRL